MTGRLGAWGLLRPLGSSALMLSLTLCLARPSLGYSVLTHEAIIDAEWDDQIQPLLLERFPNATLEQLREAHAYAYGGCVIQDMGYYPFGSRFFSHLTHYVRSGDFVQACSRNRETSMITPSPWGLCHTTSRTLTVTPSRSTAPSPFCTRAYGRSMATG